jgi:hypothetical protein
MENKCPMCNGENAVEVYCLECSGMGFVGDNECPDCDGWEVPCLGEMECLDCEYTWGKIELETA